jgi:hypothetical protein
MTGMKLNSLRSITTYACMMMKMTSCLRRVVGIEWHTANGARGVISQYQVVTQLTDSTSQEGYEGYAINEALHEMIAQCPVVHNAFMNLLSK